MSPTSLDRVRYSPASVLARMIAIGVDVTIGCCGILITLMLVSRKGLPQIQSVLVDDPQALVVPVMAASIVGLALPFLFAISVARQGATPGKALLSITVRDLATGKLLPYRRALGREAMRFLHVPIFLILGELQIIGIAVTAAVLFDMSRTRLLQTWYDRLLKTIIVAPVAEAE